MTRLPSQLQPLWPVAKRAHRFAARTSGSVARRTRSAYGDRALPLQGTRFSAETAALEPETVTLHPGIGVGAEHINRTLPTGLPAEHWVFARRAQYEVPAPYCLEIAGGITTGPDGTNITPGGVLDYGTSEYFGLAGWKEHPVYLQRQLPEIEDFDGTVVSIAARGGGRNFYHFLTDVLPRLGVFEDAMAGMKADAIYAPVHAGWQRTLLEMAGLGELKVLPASGESAVRATRLIAPSLTNTNEVAPSATVAWLRSRLPAKDLNDRPRRIYVTRGTAPRTRRVVEEERLLPMLEQRGFVCIAPEKLSPQEQIDVFAGAEVIVGPHGAALTNLLWIQPGTRVLELFHPGYVNAAFWSITEAIGGIRYEYLIADGAERFGPTSPMNKIQADVDLSAERIIAAVDRLLAD
ncbi:hypothetical protein Back2_06600 [Nocardioides baekrokdamisoli]|uniref:Glycosyltransferase 61 catalytic domain-containing protein n=1 Tax=Nocardioides baekrokdamisoli TaxID=1804624 RepID=A0A3G9IVN6_9ACTN|nr:glycosyltransferase family 61 protein [Nocardioides baekrokdamisoli]BBH16373.1 hypothetical protein Back2_06600 [Nocardioides baekrokdamisoli]